jgi:hypothetical protein
MPLLERPTMIVPLLVMMLSLPPPTIPAAFSSHDCSGIGRRRAKAALHKQGDTVVAGDDRAALLSVASLTVKVKATPETPFPPMTVPLLLKRSPKATMPPLNGIEPSPTMIVPLLTMLPPEPPRRMPTL